MSVTKSIRLDADEMDQLRAVLALMPGASESAALKHLVLRGLASERRDLAVLLFTRDGLTTGEIAERLGMSRLEVLHTLEERHVRVFDPPLELFEEELHRSDLPGSVGS